MQFNPEEFGIVMNSRFLLVKSALMQKVKDELEALVQLYANNPINGLVSKQAKVSKGENYRGLPYMVLDYPAVFEKNDIVAVRTMFWWGNFFSITLHLQGSYKQLYAESIKTNLKVNRPTNLYIAVGETPWEYYYENDNYRLLAELTDVDIEELVNSKPFLKLSLVLPLPAYENLRPFMEQGYNTLTDLLKLHA